MNEYKDLTFLLVVLRETFNALHPTLRLQNWYTENLFGHFEALAFFLMLSYITFLKNV